MSGAFFYAYMAFIRYQERRPQRHNIAHLNKFDNIYYVKYISVDERKSGAPCRRIAWIEQQFIVLHTPAIKRRQKVHPNHVGVTKAL